MSAFYLSLGFTDQQIEKLEKMFMTDVTSRYALLYQAGFNHQFVSQVSLNDNPGMCVYGVLDRAKRYGYSFRQLIKLIEEYKLDERFIETKTPD